MFKFGPSTTRQRAERSLRVELQVVMQSHAIITTICLLQVLKSDSSHSEMLATTLQQIQVRLNTF